MLDPRSYTQMSRISFTTMFIVIVESQVLEFVENFPTKLGGDEPEQAPLVPWLGGPGLLLLDSEVIFILPETDFLDMTHDDDVRRLVC